MPALREKPLPKKKASASVAPGAADPVAMIGFRLDPANNRLLAERAAQLGISPHELARHYVLELLQQHEERAALRTAFEELHQNLHQFRSDFAFAVEALLTSAGQVPKDEAQTWVEKSLSPD